jgi:protease IV
MRKFPFRLFLLAGAALVAPTSSAQTPLVLQQRLPELGRSVASTDDSTALVLNPANLAFLPGSELRWTGTFMPNDVQVPWRGQAFALALPLPFSLSAGVRLDLVDPPDFDGPSSDYQWLTWGLALRSSRAFALGATVEHSFSRHEFGDDLASFSLGASFRWIDELGISLVAQNIGAPRNTLDTVGTSYTIAAAIRPLGSRALELGLESKYIGEKDFWVPRATVGVDIPYVGRARGELQFSDPGSSGNRAWIASLGLSFYLNRNDGSFEVAGSGFAGDGVDGDGLGAGGSLNLQASLATRAFPEPVGLALGRYSVRMRLEETPDARGHVALLRELWSLEDEPLLDAVVLELRNRPADSLAHAEELRDALLSLRRHGKRVLCHLEDAAAIELYTCAAADQILLNPAGGLEFAGLEARYLYLARLLDHLGIHAEVIRIGAHKSAPERYTSEASSEVSRADKIDLLQQTERQFTEGVASGRKLSFAQVRAAAKQGPFLAQQAKNVGFVDGLAFDDEIDEALGKLLGHSTSLQRDDRVDPAPARLAPQPSIALVYVDGDMTDGRSRRVPFLGMESVGSYTIAESLQAARESPLVKAVVLRVETPGGSSMAADVIWRQVVLTAKVKPVIVSMGSYAASGGYYISAPGTRVFANAASITGSIGVFYGKADVSRLLDRIGVDVEVYKTTDGADANAFYRPYTSTERSMLERQLQQFYDLFLQRVAEGRKLDKSAVDAVGQGRVWTGEQAKEKGLVDELGGLRQALAYARKLAALPEQAPIIELPRMESSLIGRLLGVSGSAQATTSGAADGSTASGGLSLPELARGLPQDALLGRVGDVAAALAPFLLHSSQQPLMRLEDFVVQP